MQTYEDCNTSYPPTPPNIGDFFFDVLCGVMYYFNRDGEWCDNLIIEENGDEFEIVRLEVIPTPEEFKLTQ